MKKLLVIMALFYVGLVDDAQANAQNSVGELDFITMEGLRRSGVLVNTNIEGEINGLLASITIEQVFRNESDDWVNGKYHFPLPESAAVDGLTLQVGERIIRGVVKEKKQAKAEFEQAKKAGKKASILQQQRPNMFSMNLANIGPREEVIARITLVDLVEYEGQKFSYTLPTTFTPRYLPNEIALDETAQKKLEHTLSDSPMNLSPHNGFSTEVYSAEIMPKQIYKLDAEDSHRYKLTLKLNAGLNLSRVEANTPIQQRFNDQSLVVSLAHGSELMDRDFHLEWYPSIGAPKAAVFSQEIESDVTADKEYFHLLMLMPPTTNSTLSLPRDITFIIDSSGSMAGESMQQAKMALLSGLAELQPQDRFNIIDFDSNYSTLFQRSQAVTSNNILKAKSMVQGLIADGGTNMFGALQYAMNAPQEPAYLRQIIFITDGAVGNEKQLFQAISSQLNDARLFTIGIGSAPNSFFMNRAAKHGRGTYTYVRNVVNVKQQISQLFKKISQPLMRDLKLQWSTAVEQFPKNIPDLYAGEPVMVLARSSQPIKSVKAAGSMLNTPWKQSMKIGNAPLAESLNTVWARTKIATLMDTHAVGRLSAEQLKLEVLPLALKHQVMSQFTSFLAVEERVSRPEGSRSKHKAIPNRMPKGHVMPIPQTATNAATLACLGGLFLLFGLALTRRKTGS